MLRTLRNVSRLYSLQFVPSSTGLTDVQLCQTRSYPLCVVDTNIKADHVPNGFQRGLSSLIANMLGKPEELVSVTLHTNSRMCRGGKEDPTAVVQIWSVGVFDAKRNPEYSRKIFAYLLPQLKIPADKIIVFFHPIEKEVAAHLLYQELNKDK